MRNPAFEMISGTCQWNDGRDGTSGIPRSIVCRPHQCYRYEVRRAFPVGEPAEKLQKVNIAFKGQPIELFEDDCSRSLCGLPVLINDDRSFAAVSDALSIEDTMTENPYQAPRTTSASVGVLSGSREDLRSVARSQKGILVCILFYFIATIGRFVLPPELHPILGIGVLLIGFVGAVFVFMLAIKVYRVGFGIVLGILSLVPLIGLIVLLRVNGKATGTLRQNGIKVGLLGARISAI